MAGMGLQPNLFIGLRQVPLGVGLGLCLGLANIACQYLEYGFAKQCCELLSWG